MRSLFTAALAVVAVVGVCATPAAADSKTTVRLNVRGCEGCRFIAHDGRKWAGSWKKVATSTPVSAGKATIVVPRRNTPTTSLEVEHPDGLGAQNATAFVAFSWVKASGFWTGGICWGKQKGAKPRSTGDLVGLVGAVT